MKTSNCYLPWQSRMAERLTTLVSAPSGLTTAELLEDALNRSPCIPPESRVCLVREQKLYHHRAADISSAGSDFLPIYLSICISMSASPLWYIKISL